MPIEHGLSVVGNLDFDLADILEDHGIERLYRFQCPGAWLKSQIERKLLEIWAMVRAATRSTNPEICKEIERLRIG
jgi:hypothetical protein